MSINRRTFVKLAAAVGAGVLAAKYFKWTDPAEAGRSWSSDPVEGSANVKIVRSVCMMCNGRCGIQAKVDTVTGELLKLDGNAYCPAVNEYSAATAGGVVVPTDRTNPDKDPQRICVKGQAGIKKLYDPMRVLHPLKRAGPRGSNRWIRVSWDQALNEIVNGGALFSGEGTVQGLKDIYKPTTPLDAGDTNFPTEAPGGLPANYGMKSNQLVFAAGRNQQGDFVSRWVGKGFGSVNALGHGSICAGSLNVATGLMFNGKKYFKPDVNNCDFLVCWGSNPLEANYCHLTFARRVVELKARGDKLVVVDPRFTNTAAKSDNWLPIKPGKDTSLAFAFLRYIIDNNKHKSDYLRRPSAAAAGATYKTFTDMTWLVRNDNGRFVLGQDLSTPLTTGKKVVLVSGVAKEQDDATLTTADLEFDGTVLGVACKTVFSLLKAQVSTKTIAEWLTDAGVDSNVFNTVAAGLTNALRPAIDVFRGPSQHSQGMNSVWAIYLINVLLERISRKGGYGPAAGLYNRATIAAPSGNTPTGVPVTREKANYSGTAPQPSRPWYKFASAGVWQEMLPAMRVGYPYKVKAFIMYITNPAYSIPFPQMAEQALADRNAIPLFVAIDCWVNESSVWADYILPDTTYLERWSVVESQDTIKTKYVGIRQPVVGTVNPDKSYTPINPDTRMFEDIMIDLAKRTPLPCHGTDGMGPGKPLNYAYDFYNEMLSGGDFTGGLDQNTNHMKMGGRFQDPSYENVGDWAVYPYTGLIQCYLETLKTTYNIYRGTGTTAPYWSPLPVADPERDCAGRDMDTVDSDASYPLRLITHKPVNHTQSRTGQNTWLMSIQPENWVEMNASDATPLSIKTGDMVRVSSASNQGGIEMKAKVSQHVRPGVVDIPHSFGHWQLGFATRYENGQPSKGEAFRGGGWPMNPLARADPTLGDVVLTDPVGGGALFYNTKVKVEKVV